MVKTVIEKMLNERRLGKNLKGLNRSNLAEIEGCVWKSLLREVDLYTNEKEFTRGKEALQATLAKRKEEIIQELEKIRVKSRPAKPKLTCSLPN